LSPTRPSTSPLLIVRDTSLTAWMVRDSTGLPRRTASRSPSDKRGVKRFETASALTSEVFMPRPARADGGSGESVRPYRRDRVRLRRLRRSNRSAERTGSLSAGSAATASILGSGRDHDRVSYAPAESPAGRAYRDAGGGAIPRPSARPRRCGR